MRHALLGGLLEPARVPALALLAQGRAKGATGPAWQEPHTSLAADIKGAKVYRSLAPAFRALGYDDADRVLVAPLFHHLWAVVYEADWAYEAHQLAGAQKPGRQWLQQFRLVLEGLELFDGTVHDRLEELADYFELETRLLASADTFDKDDLARAVRLRCSDLKAFLGVAAALTGRPWARELSTLLSPLMSFIDLEDDLRSTGEDAADGSFNTYNFAVRRWGESEGRSWLDEMGSTLMYETVGALSQVSPRTLQAMRVVLGRPGSDLAARRLRLEANRPRRMVLSGLQRTLLDGTPRPFGPHWQFLDTSGGNA
ncbi:hypothetical protein QWM81_08505 [Streptomyces ficellus]|uniref:Terpene synthase n=1 Tax=Streptomyces ficellus TaxID=1977088 RepID=A0ABT7Z4A0_9ACTN|nr:hypothetical protein [Streptomyces ficellus]MDN3294087.1 hypothetical protein [Streptomyces ficellus]